MATLNVKKVSDELYERLRERAKRDHRSIAQEVIYLLETRLDEDERRESVLDLRGLGRDAWRGMDASEHVRKERDAWD